MILNINQDIIKAYHSVEVIDMEQKIRKIQRDEVKKFLDQCDLLEPIMPVILDDSGLLKDEMGRKYVRAIFSNPEKMGRRCVVSNKCKTFLKYVSEDDELKRKVEFVNVYLVNGIQNTAVSTKECTIYIMPDYSFGKQLLFSLSGVVWNTFTKTMGWLIEKIWKLILMIISGMGAVALLFQFIEFLGEMDNLVTVYKIICNWLEKMSVVSWIVTVAGCITIVSVLMADRACTKAVGQQKDHIVFLMPSIGRLGSFFFELRWLKLNKFYRAVEGENDKNNKFFYIADNKKSLCSQDNVYPECIFEFDKDARGGYRYLLAVLEHYSSLEQERKLKHHPGID